MINRFHRSLKASLHARAADSNWVSHLTLVLLGLSKGRYWFLSLGGCIWSCSHHTWRTSRHPRIAHLQVSQQDGNLPCLVLEWLSKFFRLQIGTRVDSVSVDRLKPSISDSPVTSATPRLPGHPPLRPSQRPPEPASVVKSSISQMKKSVRFLTQSDEILRLNPGRQV